jgi:glutamate synthase (NADPH/NADH) large chain
MMPGAWRGLYEYCNSVMEPWDGPAAVVACDGRWAIAGLDRNGLRPLRWSLSDDGLLAVGSETGMAEIAPERVIERGAVTPGRLIAVDLEAGGRLPPRARDSRLAQPPSTPMSAGWRMSRTSRPRSVRVPKT